MQDKSGNIDTWVPSVVGYQIFKKGLFLNLLKYISWYGVKPDVG